MEYGPNLLRVHEEGYGKWAICLELVLVVHEVTELVQDRCPRDQLRVNGGIYQFLLAKGGVISLVRWEEYVTNDIRKGYASYPAKGDNIVLVLLKVFVAEARSRVWTG
jgi:hypothetical protein